MKLHTGSSKYVMESKEDKDLRIKASREERAAKLEILESSYGYEDAGEEDRVGWLVNFSSTSVVPKIAASGCAWSSGNFDIR